MKHIVLTIALLMPAVAPAKPATQIAWTPEMLNAIKRGNADQGKTLAATCAACHGAQGEGSKAEIQDGETLPAIPALAGQLATYTYKQLRDYANGDRANDTMAGIAKNLTEQNAADLAVWYATLTREKDGARTGKVVDAAKNLVSLGDGKRLIPPCAVCHGSDGLGEKMDVPAIAGQHADYLAGTLTAFQRGTRHNDVYSRMRFIAQQLTAEEIKALAEYYQTLN